jgi:hypothetical protein
MSLTNIAARLYMDRPTSDLYHYTSLGSILKIIPERALHATDARFLTDSSEMRVIVENLKSAMTSVANPDDFTAGFHAQFRAWLDNRLSEPGNAVFVTCFTQNGNLLSQWRSYGDPGKGLSIGFDPEKLADTAYSQSFMVEKCIYESDRQKVVAAEVLSAIEQQARLAFPDSPARTFFQPIFDGVETDLLKIAVLFKDHAFSEENEWRLVSPVVSNYLTSPVKFREGRSLLTSYLSFELPSGHNRRVELKHVWIGPTPHPNAALVSVNEFFAKHGSSPRFGIGYCDIPYRTW